MSAVNSVYILPVSWRTKKEQNVYNPVFCLFFFREIHSKYILGLKMQE